MHVEDLKNILTTDKTNAIVIPGREAGYRGSSYAVLYSETDTPNEWMLIEPTYQWLRATRYTSIQDDVLYYLYVDNSALPSIYKICPSLLLTQKITDRRIRNFAYVMYHSLRRDLLRDSKYYMTLQNAMKLGGLLGKKVMMIGDGRSFHFKGEPYSYNEVCASTNDAAVKYYDIDYYILSILSRWN